jgi:hypothetical protein
LFFSGEEKAEGRRPANPVDYTATAVGVLLSCMLLITFPPEPI